MRSRGRRSSGLLTVHLFEHAQKDCGSEQCLIHDERFVVEGGYEGLEAPLVVSVRDVRAVAVFPLQNAR